MVNTVCPFCGYDSSSGEIFSGAIMGAGAAALMLFQPELGVAALTGLALQKWLQSGKEERQCPNCGLYYHN